MNVFLTGATGYIGSAAAKALIRRGHGVRGLTHSPQKMRGLADIGVEPVVGDLKQPESYRKAADSSDVLIHAAFEYSPDGPEADRIATEALISSAKSAGKPRLIVYTSGVWVLGAQKGGPADEETPPNPIAPVAWRPGCERRVLEAAGNGVSAVVIRPGCVYGGRGGLYGMMMQSAVENHAVRVVEGGLNHWASVYLDDLAELYRLIAEKRPTKAVYHAADSSVETIRTVAEAFLEAAGVAPFADESLRAFLECGVARFGPARFLCRRRGKDRFVPLSCKKRLACSGEVLPALRSTTESRAAIPTRFMGPPSQRA